MSGGCRADLAARDQIVLTVIWLRRYPTNEASGFLFGVSDSAASRVRARVPPLRAAAGRDAMRMPDPGKQRRTTLDSLLTETPELAVIIDASEQRVQRPRERQAADGRYSGTKKRHMHKRQAAVNRHYRKVTALSRLKGVV